MACIELGLFFQTEFNESSTLCWSPLLPFLLKRNTPYFVGYGFGQQQHHGGYGTLHKRPSFTPSFRSILTTQPHIISHSRNLLSSGRRLWLWASTATSWLRTMSSDAFVSCLCHNNKRTWLQSKHAESGRVSFTVVPNNFLHIVDYGCQINGL